ncbi:MAG: Rne/Rng family ribonuclease [Acidobacteriaceae bacterium]|nr:Rne/Rng family ribonuclease [Acidobacteriaceae bacterium]
MSKELVIGCNRHETKVAVLEDDQLVEVYFQRANEYSLAGSIHKGRVTRVLPGMQSAFVDLGLERDTFLYVSDFFEEHEDIDTVADEKPLRTERRDRIQNRGPEKGTEEVSASEQRPESAEIIPIDSVEQAEGESGLVTAEARPLAGTAEGNERTEADRGARGDRRGRRSRRRRHRGRGFPDNKYAQPSPGAGSEEVGEAPEGEDESDEREVILLPGESLAKYRRAAAGERAPERAGIEAEEPATSYRGADTGRGASAADDSEPEEDLEAEAEELEITEKVFSHHDDESPEDVEEKIDEVRQDQPIPPPDLETHAADEPVAGQNTITGIEEPGEEVELFFGRGEEVREDPEPGEPIEANELELEAADEGIPEVDETIEDNALPIAEVSPSVAGEQESAPQLEIPQAQTARVRDTGERYMHRSSRRMRRRRGGNRFGQQPQENFSESGGMGTGTAVAMEPEARLDARRESVEERSPEKPERALPSITDLLKPGQEIIVQIAKEPLGQKGARITSHIALPGRYVVFMPSVNHLGVSRKVSSEEERQRLKRILQKHRAGTTGGFIVRTAGEGVPEDEIAADMNFLYSLWLDIRQKAEKKPAPALLHYDLDIVQRTLRDQVTEDFKAIWVDSEDMYESVLTFMHRFQPSLVNRVKMYTRQAPIFDAFNITQELEKALRPKVWLKSGGYIVINQTEALVAIDINTGKFVGKSNRLEDTIAKTNLEAVKEIVRQIRLRDLGGIIVVDFIDMDERKNRQKVMQALEETMRADKAPYKILQFNDFGLVAITRKRVKQSLERTLCAPCPHCEGAGYVKSVQTVISEILVEAQKIAKAIEAKDVVLRVHPDVAKVLKASSNRYLEELEEVLSRPVLVVGDPNLHHEKFDLA